MGFGEGRRFSLCFEEGHFVIPDIVLLCVCVFSILRLLSSTRFGGDSIIPTSVPPVAIVYCVLVDERVGRRLIRIELD